MSNEIIDAIERAYESFSAPMYFAITRRMSERPFEPLVEEIGTRFELIDTTDEDEDVSFIYAVSAGGRQWALGLSAVGPYAVFARAAPSSQVWTEILTPGTPGLTDDERWLLNRLSAQPLRLLTREELELPVPLNIADMEPAHVRVFQALFTSSDILPWDDETFQRLGLI